MRRRNMVCCIIANDETNCIFISFCTKFRCPIDMEEVYPVALVSFLAEGGTRKGKRSFDQVKNRIRKCPFKTSNIGFMCFSSFSGSSPA